MCPRARATVARPSADELGQLQHVQCGAEADFFFEEGLIGSETANRKYVSYEIDKSVARGNGLLGVRIINIKDQNGRTDLLGAIPAQLIKVGAPVYTWEYGKLGEWVENAYQVAQRR